MSGRDSQAPSGDEQFHKSITCMLQQSILQLCNEHVGYSQKLQILGVLCMTVDDEQQEIVVKVNNTLKRVNPVGGKEPSSAIETPISTHNGSFSPSHMSPLGRKGRKGVNPVRVEQNVEEAVTILPEAPEDSESFLPSDDEELREPSSHPTSPTIQKASGSAKRKASQPVREAQYAVLNGSAEDSSDSGDEGFPPPPNSGLSLPVFVSTANIEPINIAPDEDESAIDYSLTNGSSIKEPEESPHEPFYMNSYKTEDDTSNGPRLMPELPTSVAVLNLAAGNFGLPASAQVPYSSTPIKEKFSAVHDGLTVRYTSTGPITVGANGREVSNTSRIKDIILYNEQTFSQHQKGAKVDPGYVIDKLGMDGRKRRRRAADDFFTPEELAEYLGQADEHAVAAARGPFKCEFCQEVHSDVTKYIQHTLGAHAAYICHQCGKSFTTKSSLLRHRPIHTGLRRFACSICKKTFYRKDKCKAHIKRHMGAEVQSVVAHIETTVPGTGQRIQVPVE